MKIYKDFSLNNYNTLGLDVRVSRFVAIHTEDDVQQLVKSGEFRFENRFILGGGSNVLFKNDYQGTVYYPDIPGVQVLGNQGEYILIKAFAGVEWDAFVEYCVLNNYGGAENLSYIPGKVGASPVQNIGAYGVEAKDIIESVNGFFLDTGRYGQLDNAECEFDYRNSIFKNCLRNSFLITSVVFKLKRANYDLNISYGNLRETLENSGKEVSLKTIRQAVIQIRKNKLPDHRKIFNAGSFFKNPVVSYNELNRLLKMDSSLPHFNVGNDLYKVPAAYLIDKAGLKGLRLGNVGVHEKQPLVLVNFGKAKPAELLELAKKVQIDVNELFGIELIPEVNII